jgi:hypothetical protein
MNRLLDVNHTFVQSLVVNMYSILCRSTSTLKTNFLFVPPLVVACEACGVPDPRLQIREMFKV